MNGPGLARRQGILSVEIRGERDVVLARQRARHVARLLGFDASEATRVATAVSEIARNAWKYAGGGRVAFSLRDGSALGVTVSDGGPGMPMLEDVLAGRYVSTTGMGLGIVGSRRLVDTFEVSTSAAGTTIQMSKRLPDSRAAGERDLARIADELARARPDDPLDELTAQNQELLQALDQLRERDRVLVALNEELEDTNRGVVALYAELDEKADDLRRASELKSRFLSNMSHEFRTPLNTVVSFCRLLLDETDGPLTAEQRTQVGFARDAADGMIELVNDLLDLAKVESGKTVVRRAPFEARDLFGALRGMLRPLLATARVDLVFEDPAGVPTLDTDEGKLSQILRNLVSNALKFTEVGEVRVSARADGGRVTFSVADTGIGIAPEDQELVFGEYTQVESHLQRRVKGTGLGLPLARRLAELLGGRITLRSAPGVGSTFSVEVPIAYEGGDERAAAPEVTRLLDPTRFPVLVLEEGAGGASSCELPLRGSAFQPVPAASSAEARRLVREVRPVAAVVDVTGGDESAWSFVAELKAGSATRELPVLLVTTEDQRHRAKALGADGRTGRPVDPAWLLERLKASVDAIPRDRVLVVDDDPAARYLVAGVLAGTRFEMLEAEDGARALELLGQGLPAGILLDLQMPGLTGEEVLARVRADPATAGLPVVVFTGRALEQGDRARLAGATAFLSKEASRGAMLAVIRDAFARAASRPSPEAR